MEKEGLGNQLGLKQTDDNLSHTKQPSIVFPSNLGKGDIAGTRGDLTEFMHFEARATFYKDSKDKGTSKDEETIWHCYLPMPKQLQHNQGHSYQNKETGQLAKTVGGSIDDLLGGDGKGALNSTIDTAQENAIQKFRKIGTGLTGALTGTNTEALLQLKTGTKANPNMEVLYDGSGFRTFNFAWDLIPDNETEQQNLRLLTNLFRFYSAPEFPDEVNQMWLNFPNTWKIHFRHATESPTGSSTRINTWIPEIYDCVCSNVQLSFNDGQPRWHSRKDTQGAPLQYTLQLSFSETSISSKNLIAKKDFSFFQKLQVLESQVNNPNLSGEEILNASGLFDFDADGSPIIK
jgi:hypothetical protein